MNWTSFITMGQRNALYKEWRKVATLSITKFFLLRF